MTQTPHSDLTQAARRWFGRSPDTLSERERRVLHRAVDRKTISRDANATFDDSLTFGQRMADRVARFGGSWAFIMSFGAFLVVWTGINLTLGKAAFDSYPFIFLNLLLSMLAAIQAPVILMSQNRQASKDRLDAAHDYEVNLKAEIEIMALHEKLDQLRTREMEGLLAKQEEQIVLLTRLLEAKPGGAGPTT
jgi:uncharacterized membrane protein